MKIYLARHGQSRWQVERDDDWDSPLTTVGQVQAQHLAAWLAGHQALDNEARLEIGRIRASPLLRARQTAVPITKALQLSATTDEQLREAEFLVSPHLPAAESPYQTPVVDTPSPTYVNFKVQAEQALHNLIADAETSQLPVLAVSHGGLISTILRLATGSDTVSFWIYNATLNLIEWKRGRWHLVYLNLWDHLPPELRTW